MSAGKQRANHGRSAGITVHVPDELPELTPQAARYQCGRGTRTRMSALAQKGATHAKTNDATPDGQSVRETHHQVELRRPERLASR
jgi:hypothetical protein